jgi:hypothetical protein
MPEISDATIVNTMPGRDLQKPRRPQGQAWHEQRHNHRRDRDAGGHKEQPSRCLDEERNVVAGRLGSGTEHDQERHQDDVMAASSVYPIDSSRSQYHARGSTTE